jgi:hypothetical protein
MEEFNFEIFAVNATMFYCKCHYDIQSTVNKSYTFYSGLDCKEMSIKLGYTTT